jgi:hypothetical protein
MKSIPIVPILLLVLLLGAPGCALLGSDKDRYFGEASLSDAAREARRDSTEKGRALDVGIAVPTYVTEEPVTTALEVSDASDGADAGGPGVGGDVDRLHLGLVVGGGTLGGQSYDGYGLVGIDVGVYFGSQVAGAAAGRWRTDIVGTIGLPRFAGESIAGESFDNEVELALDVSARYYLTPGHTFVGAYPLAGIRFGTLFWDYARPLTVIENGELRTIKADYINYFAFYGGMGVSLVQVRHMQLGTHLTAGVRLYGWDTDEGFSNDFFPATGFGSVTLEAVYRF